jgi:5-methyltetrahydrofolate--homocysteine methyltransferase
VYGYFPCAKRENTLIVYSPGRPDEEVVRFAFPRQPEGRHLCLADYFLDEKAGRRDVVALQLVTMGGIASKVAEDLYKQNRYDDYLHFHGLAVEGAEALAEFWHHHVRRELGIAGSDAQTIELFFMQAYQGSRYSFGYPACPRLEDQAPLCRLLRAERIGISLSEECELVPEQSTSAMIVHHPEARYFSILGD